jgi:vitamin B12 transporter
MKLNIIILALGISASGDVCALQNSQINPQIPSRSTVNLSEPVESVSITGARTPLSNQFVAGALSVIDSAHIKASGALTLSDLLRTLPSVNISQSGPVGTLTEIRFRGSESNHVLVMLDGVEINDLGQGGLIDLSHLMLANISRIEVLRGPQSALWGSSAVAGIISITSKTPDNAHGGGIGVSYGNKHTSQLQSTVSGSPGKWQYSVSASHLDTEGENIAREGDESDGYENTTAYAKLAYGFSPINRITSNIRAVDYTSDFDSTNFSTGLIADADNQSKGEQLSLGLTWDFSVKDSFWSQQLSYQYSEQENKNFSSAVFSGSTKGEKQRVVYNHNFRFSRGHINVGSEAVDQTFTQKGPVVFGDPNQRQSSSTLSFIADTHQAINKALSLTASYRYDNNDEFENADSYRVGVNYRLSENVRSFISYGEAIKNPTFTERFGFFPGTFLGNPELEPESSASLEVGIAGSWQGYQYHLSWYQAELENEILGFVFDAETSLFTAQNAQQESKREGIEIEVSQALKRWRWAISYAYLDATQANSVELRRARHSGSAWLAYDITNTHSLYLQADYTGARSDRFFPPFPEPSQILVLDNYWLVSANYSYVVNQNITASLRMSNALNTGFEDVVGFSGESRRVLASLAYRW